MAPETAALVSAVVVAAITTGPAYLSSRQAQTAVADEGALTEEGLGVSIGVALTEVVDASMRVTTARVDAVRHELRDDIRELREWQASHAAEHILLRQDPDA